MARIGSVKDKIPNDRVTDGIDQSAFLLMGEDYLRRDYMCLHGSSPFDGHKKARRWGGREGVSWGGAQSGVVI